MAIEIATEKKHAVISPAQGSQKIGMGRDLAQAFPEAAAIWHEADKFLDPIIGTSFSSLVWEGKKNGTSLAPGEAAEVLKKTEIAQPTIITDSLARFAVLKNRGLSADWHAGLSLGAVSAAVTSGAIDIEGAIKLGQGRGEAFKFAVDHSPRTTMFALNNIPNELAEELMERFNLSLCLKNTETQIVLGGEVRNNDNKDVASALDLLKDRLDPEEYKEKVAELEVDAAFHSVFMKPAVSPYRAVIESIPIQAPTEGKLIIGSTVSELISPQDIRDALVLQLTETEDWSGVTKFLLDRGVSQMTELSGVAKLSAMNRRQFRGTVVDKVSISASNNEQITTAMKWHTREVKGGSENVTQEEVAEWYARWIADRIDGDEEDYLNYMQEDSGDQHFINDLTLDSQDMLALRAAIRAKYGKNVPDEEAVKNVTLGSAIEATYKLLNS